MINVQNLNIKIAREKLKAREFTARELAEACLKNIDEKDGEIHAFLEVYDDVLDQANEADKLIAKKLDLPLLGIPIAIKDNMLAEGRRATAGSKILEGYTATYDSTAVKKLKEAGAVLVGRTNMDEFALGSSTENSAFGPTRNPHDLSRVPGGTSGGSAAAVASNMALGACGSDTGGSVRQPAALCGIVGLKTTYGRVSRSGLIAAASSFDQIGPLAKSVSDAELIYEVIKGRDLLDSTSIEEDSYPRSRSYLKKIGIPRKFIELAEPPVRENLEQVIEKFRSLGYQTEDIDLPHLHYSLAVFYIINYAEVSSNLARFDGVKYGLHVGGESGIDDYFKTRGEGFGREVRRRILLGTYVLSAGYYDAFYGSATNVRRKISSELRHAFEKYDLIMMPTSPSPAWKIGEKVNDPMAMYLEDIFTVPVNISGVPAISLPSGSVDIEGKSLPLGIQLLADLGREDNLFKAGKEFLNEAS